MGIKRIRFKHVLQQDEVYPEMWRVLSPSGALSDMLNHSRALDIQKELNCETGGGKVVGRLRQHNPIKKKGPRRPSA